MRLIKNIFILLLLTSIFAANTVSAEDAATPETTPTSGASGTAAPTSSTPGAAASPQGGGDSLTYLRLIAENTRQTLAAVNNIPTYLNTLTQMALSWLTIEDNPENSFIMQNQGDFANLGQIFNQSTVTQNDMQMQVSADLLGAPIADLTTPKNSPKILATVPDANDMLYTSVINGPPIPHGSFSPTNYLRYATGLLIPHLPVSNSTQTDAYSKALYSGYYKTILAANSFNTYVLSGALADSQPGNQSSPIQDKLMKAASGSSWLAQVASEELGKVLRDILLFESQNYVLMTKSLQIQKQQLIAQAITNSLIIATNQGIEPELMSYATGAKKRN